MERLVFNTGTVPAATTAGIAAPPRREPDRLEHAEGRIAAAERLDRGAFNWLLAFTFVLFMRPQDQLPILEPLHLADVTGTLAIIALILGRLGRGAPVTRDTLELRLILAFGGIMLATAPFSIWPGGAVGLFTDLFSKVMVVFALMINTITTRKRFEQFVGIVVAGTTYIAIYTVANYLRGINLIEGSRASGAVGGLFGNPNDMALNMVAFLPLAVVTLLARGRAILRLIALVGIPFIAASIIFSKSRGGLVGLLAMLVVLLYQLRRVRPGIAALVVLTCLSTIPFLPDSFTERMSSIVNPEEDPTGSREARKRLLREGYQAFLANPVLGLGAGQFANYNADGRREEAWRETHNAVLQVAAELGIGGLVIFTVIIGSGYAAVIKTTAMLRRSRPPRRSRGRDPSRNRREPLELYSVAVIASLTGWFMAAMFASVAYYWTFYIVLGLALSLRDLGRAEHAPEAVRATVPDRARAA